MEKIKKPKDLSRWLGLFATTKDGKVKRKRILSIVKGIVNIRVFGRGRSLKGMAHYPIKDILYLENLKKRI